MAFSVPHAECNNKALFKSYSLYYFPTLTEPLEVSSDISVYLRVDKTSTQTSNRGVKSLLGCIGTWPGFRKLGTKKWQSQNFGASNIARETTIYSEYNHNHVHINLFHWKPLAESSQMSTHVSGLKSFLRFFA